MTAPFDLPAYLARITLPVAPAADADGLRQVQRAHRLALPFENLDALLGRGVSRDPGEIFDKLVRRRRGGYCFEHNQLLLDALHALGFEARLLLARVWLGATEVPPVTHMLCLVRIDGRDWIADAGFGGSYAPPMPLADGAETIAVDGTGHRLTRDADHGWMLWRRGDPLATDGRETSSDWARQYSFTEAEVWPSDVALANAYISRVPGHRFTTTAIVSIVLPTGFATLTGRSYRRRNGDQFADADIATPLAYRLRLGMVFGIDLTAEEVARLGIY